MEAKITPKYDLKQMVYIISRGRGRIWYGKITAIKAEIYHKLGCSNWHYFYNVQVGEQQELWNIPEARVCERHEDANAILHPQQ